MEIDAWGNLTAELIEKSQIATDDRFAFLAAGSVNFRANHQRLLASEAAVKRVRERMTAFLAAH